MQPPSFYSTMRTITLLGFLGAMMLGAGAAQADPPAPTTGPLATVAVSRSVASRISYQGRLTDAAGNPVNDSANLVFQFWDAATDGSQVGADSVRSGTPLQSGLFSVDLDVPPGALTGQALWLRIQVNGQWLTPRQELLPVPYALSLRPGAVIAGDSADPVVTLGNAGSGAALRAAGNIIGVDAVGQTGVSAVGNAIGVAATGLTAIRGEGGIGVHGEGDIGVRGHSSGGDGVVGESQGGATKAAVRGTSMAGAGGVFTSTQAAGVSATSVEGYGLAAQSGDAIGVYAHSGRMAPLILYTGHIGVLGLSEQGTGVKGVGGTGLEASGVVTGVIGTASAMEGRGVAGVADNYGGIGVAGHAAFGIGVKGEGETGLFGLGATGVGVQGRGAGAGVSGASAFGDGVVGTTDGGADTAAVRGTASDRGYGAYFSSARGPGLAAFGAEGVHGSDTSGGSYGVHGVSTNIGVQGDGGAVGVVGQSTTGLGVGGWSSSSSGVFGQTASGGANGVSGVNTAGGPGVRGESSGAGGAGVWGVGGSYGLYGQTAGTAGVRGYYTTNGNFADLGTASYGVHAVAFSQDGMGVLAQSVTGDAVRAETNAAGRAAVFAKNRGAGRAVEAEAETVAVLATSIQGSGSDQAALRAVNLNANHGMAGKLVNQSDYHTAHFENDGSGGVLFLLNSGDNAGNGGGDFITAFSRSADYQFRVLSSGEVRSDVGFNTPSQDVAELLPAVPGVQPGDVLVIGDDGRLIPSASAYATTVAGVYSTRPGFVGGQAMNGSAGDSVPLAVVGVVPVKVSAENGAIRPGDLLVTSATAGHAMRTGSNPPVGTVIGKALERLDQGRGVIKMLATLQ